MNYRGRIEGGVVVFEGQEKPAEGTLVNIEPVASSTDETTAQRLLKWAGKLDGLPQDASVNLDHYLYGHPKK